MIKTHYIYIWYSFFSLVYLVVQSHGLGLTPIQNISSIKRSMLYYEMCLQFGMACQNCLINLALPLYLYPVSDTRDLLYSRHRSLVFVS